MLEEDRDAIHKMKADFEMLANLAENDFENHVNFELRMNHYNTVYTAATRNASKTSEYPGFDVGDILYMDYQEMLTRYVMRFRDLGTLSEHEMFRKILSIWGHYKILMRWNMRAFAYLSRYYIVNHSKPSLLQVALGIFLEQVFKSHADVVSRVTQELLVAERAGTSDSGSGTLITRAIDLFSSMSLGDTQSIYAEKFLRPYLARTRVDYQELLGVWGAATTASEFLQKIRQALAEEDERCVRYFPSEDRRVIISCVEGVLIDSPVTQEKVLSAQDGLPATLATRDEAQLTLYYDFFSRKSAGVKLMADLLRQQIEKEGAELSREYEGEETAVNVVAYVTAMMKLQEVFPHLLSVSFRMDFSLCKAVREGLEHAFNGGVKVRSKVSGQVRQVPFCEWLAHYVDVVLQQGKGSVEEDIERIVDVLAYVTERDRFLVNTRERMAERILFPLKRFDETNERCLIQRIRQRCGPASTAYLEGMLNDVDTSSQFHAMEVLASQGAQPSFEVRLLVAKKGIWPLQLATESSVRPPPFLQAVLDDLKAAYLQGTVGRVLTWSHESSSAEVQGNFLESPTTFSLSALQALVLLSFNDVAPTTLSDGTVVYEQVLSDIVSATGLSFDQLHRALPPILKGRVLLRQQTESAPTTLQATDKLRFNAQFTSRLRRIRFPPSLVRVSVAGADEVAKQVHEDRKPVVDACLVRIMKSRRVLEHAELVDQCQRQLVGSFTPDVKFIKQRIEDLLRREFIERDSTCANRYKYLA